MLSDDARYWLYAMDLPAEFTQLGCARLCGADRQSVSPKAWSRFAHRLKFLTLLCRNRGRVDRVLVEPLSWKTTTPRGYLFNLAVKFERTYGPEPVVLSLLIGDPRVRSSLALA